MEIPLTHPYADISRSIGRGGYGLRPALRPPAPRQRRPRLPCARHHARRPRRLKRRQAYHPTSTCPRPAALPMGLREGLLDE